MHENILEEYNLDYGGYIGYSFVKSYFVNQSLNEINLDFINILFPSITQIIIRDLSYINGDFLEEIIKFLLDKQNTDFYYFELRIEKKYGKSNIDLQYKKHKIKFNEIGYELFSGYLYESYYLVSRRFGV